MVSGNTSSCKVDISQPVTLQQAHTISVQRTGERSANTDQVAAVLEATAASPQLGRSSDQLPAQDALDAQTNLQVPAHETNHIQASAVLPPAHQAASPQAGDQTSSPQQALPAVDVTNHAEFADAGLGAQTQDVPELPVPASMPALFREPTQALADSSCSGAQLPVTAQATAAQQGMTVPAGLLVKIEDHMSDDTQTAGQNQSDPAPDEQRQSAPATEATAAPGGTMDTEPGTSAAWSDALVKAEPEPDTSMGNADKRSAADIFEQTVMECKKVVSEASSVLLNREAAGAGGRRTSRIAASERATMWHNELQGLLNRCKMPQLYIGVLGDTGDHLFR